jgi:hypothetical protein
MSRKALAGLGAGAALVAGVVVLVILLAGSSHPTSGGRRALPGGRRALPGPAGEQFGASVNRLFNDRTYSRAQIDTQLAALHDTGATLARTDTLWELTEPSPPSAGVHRYNWAFDDLIAGSLAAHGLRWLPTVDYAPGWASSPSGVLHAPPRSAADFAVFAAAVAARYGVGGAFWRAHPRLSQLPVQIYEIWNEPDNAQFWVPAPNPRAYASLYLTARAAIQAVDPSARVIIGGLTKAPRFLGELVNAHPDLVGHVDGVAVHPYGPPPAVLAKVRRARATLADLGLGGVPLYVTEFGWSIHPAGTVNFAPASRRPSYISTTLAALGHTNCNVAGAVLYTWITPERNPKDKEDWFGIHPPAGGTSPDTAAFTAGIRRAQMPAATREVC